MVATIVPSTLGARIRSRREELGMTQGELANRAYIRQPSLSDIEQDKTKEITARTLGSLCRALGIRWEFALYGTGQVEPADGDGLTPEALVIAKWFDKLTDPRDRAIAETGAMGEILRVLQRRDLLPTVELIPDSSQGTRPAQRQPPAPSTSPTPAKTHASKAGKPARQAR